MTNARRIYRFEPNGPDGLKPMELSADDFQEMPSAQHVHVYFQDPELGLSTGIWDTTTMQEAFGPYPWDEFIFVLDGAFTMLDGDGNGVPAKQGQSVIFRNGVPVSWKQDGYLKKYYITYKDPRAKTPEALSADGGIQALDADMALTDADLVARSSTPQREKVLFNNDHSNFEVGLWDTQVMKTPLEPIKHHEFCQIVAGEVTLTEGDGTQHHFTTGDVFFIPEGTVCAWDVPQYLRKFYAILNTNIRPGS